MLKNILLWVIAIILTLSAAVYQRLTGPTHPISDNITFAESRIEYTLNRNHGGSEDLPVTILVADTIINGTLMYKRYKTDNDYTPVPMIRIGDSLTASLPHQPPAGKLEYYLYLYTKDSHVSIPNDHSVVIRFKGAVPKVVLAPHIIFIFMAMLWSTRTGLEALKKDGKTGSLTKQTVLLLLVGGMIMGPIVQKFAFGEFWTGVPFGWDLTDNKTLVAFVGWLIALWRHRHCSSPRFWVLAASIILIGIFTIPHSTMGSELNYSTGEVETG
ncbi:MAG: hypothetical protein KAR42_14630 [candidate division Zixibacteria bacterium]|nr:hypothetical protein [candidate division Zixibacteria bacterium]